MGRQCKMSPLRYADAFLGRLSPPVFLYKIAPRRRTGGSHMLASATRVCVDGRHVATEKAIFGMLVISSSRAILLFGADRVRAQGF